MVVSLDICFVLLKGPGLFTVKRQQGERTACASRRASDGPFSTVERSHGMEGRGKRKADANRLAGCSAG